MRIRIYLFPVIFIFLLSLSGCATWGYSSMDKPEGSTLKTYAPTQPHTILITKRDITDRKYEVIVDITATVHKTTPANNLFRPHVNHKLRQKAAEVGADAVILVRYGEPGVRFWKIALLGLMGTGSSWEGKGRAIKFISE